MRSRRGPIAGQQRAGPESSAGAEEMRCVHEVITRRRTVRVAASFLLLSLLVLALGVQAVAAASGTSGGSSTTTPTAGTEGRGGVAAMSVATSPSAGTAGRGGIAGDHLLVAGRRDRRPRWGRGALATASSPGTRAEAGRPPSRRPTAGIAAQAQSASSGSSGTSTWIWVGAALAVLAGKHRRVGDPIVAAAPQRSRRRRTAHSIPTTRSAERRPDGPGRTRRGRPSGRPRRVLACSCRRAPRAWWALRTGSVI